MRVEHDICHMTVVHNLSDKTPFIRFVLYLNKDPKTEYSRNNCLMDLSFVLRNPYRTTDTVQDPHEVT